ncbi:MAG: hypothetical protein E6R07_09835 [Nevskiaceae bacterium]|nr:MAG: hypothetical protein E6R07_09835 [Nevskiaceae bacterium]
MRIQHSGAALLATLLFSGAALAQSNVEADTQRNINQQERIEQGLKSGQLSTREAGQLERQEQHIDKMEARDLRNGSISPAEQQRLNAAQNRASRDIAADKHNAVVGNPDSASSQRLQADVQRNVNQQQRIENGERSGALTARETGRLEAGQAHVERREAHAAADGHVSAREQARIQRSENRQSRRIGHKKHNARGHG